MKKIYYCKYGCGAKVSKKNVGCRSCSHQGSRNAMFNPNKKEAFCVVCHKKLSKSKNLYCSKHRLVGPRNGMFGKHHTEKSKLKVSKKLKGRVFTQEHKDKIGAKHKNKILSKETKDKISKSKKGKSLINNGTFKKGHSPWNEGTVGVKKQTEESKKKISISCKKLWENEDYRKKVIKNSRKYSRPNKPETILNNLLNDLFPYEYKYVGSGGIVIDRFNPDFINCNGQKKIIEVYGDYYHTLPNYIERDKRRLEAYKKYGYKTLIVWEHELKDLDTLKNRLIDFSAKSSLDEEFSISSRMASVE